MRGKVRSIRKRPINERKWRGFVKLTRRIGSLQSLVIIAVTQGVFEISFGLSVMSTVSVDYGV